MTTSILNEYKSKSSAAEREADKNKRLANNYSLYRLVVFGGFILTVCIAVSVDRLLIVAFSLIILIICFSWLIKKQGQFNNLKNYFVDIKKVNDNEIASIESYGNMYNNGSVFIDDLHSYSSDLDIFGPNSLFQLISRCATFPGITKLASWLNIPANKTNILSRQAAIIELKDKNEWKIDLQANLLFSLKQQTEQLRNLVKYLNITVEIKAEKWLKTYSHIAPWLLITVMATSIFIVPARYLVLVLAFYNYRLVSSKSEIIDKTDLIAGKISSTLQHFVLAFTSIENETWESAYLKDLAAKVSNHGTMPVSKKIQLLSRLIHKLNYRLNNIVRLILNIFFIWDMRQIIAIENWKKDNFRDIEIAFDVIAEFEALISLAGLHINYPEWCFPEIAEGNGYTLVATELSHPLIGSNKRVENNYKLDDAFKIDIITGSNMAGKSTFLRTIGINTILALCGAPVCAKAMRVSLINIISYMRIKDNLNESTSTFKAELDRLQMLLAAVEKDNKVFFLIDEMLRGTNSVDKYLGSKAIIEQLIRKKAVGMVATHDLQIADLEASHPDYVRNFYFDIQVKDGEMLFDYKIKDGACKTFNASLLLKQIGIEIG